jgi:hypothetical protein
LIHPSASAIVHQQLDLLATSVFRWSGEAWPGVPMQWEVQEDEEGGRRHEEEAASQPQWSTTVSLSLPHLGQLDVRLRLIGSEVRAQLVAKRDETVEQLRAHRAALSRRMSAAGLELSSLQVDTELAAS